MRGLSTLWKANIIAFASSFCVMVIELVASRILAPYIGVSLYTWTGIIGVILAGIALGNYIGGRVADRYASPSLLVIILFAGTLATMSILPAAKAVGSIGWFAELHPMLNSTLRVFGIFFIPALILSMVSPMVIKLTLVDLGKTGGVVGTIYACSTAGSILGTFMTGFFFILWWGTRTTVWLVVIVLILIGIAAWFSWKMPRRWSPSPQSIAVWLLAALIVVSAIIILVTRDAWEQRFTKESNYYSINVLDESGVGGVTTTGGLKILVLDHLIHSFVMPNDPLYMKYDYLTIFSGLIKYTTGENTKPATLHLGGGGYSFPRYMEYVYPGSKNVVIEIDPEVTAVARKELGLRPDTSIITNNQDARIFLYNRKQAGEYDYVIGDVYNDLSTPFHLSTLEFNNLVKSSMKDNGIYLVNVIDNYSQGEYMPAFINTLEKSFRHVYLFSPNEYYGIMRSCTFVIAATDRALDLKELAAFVSRSEDYADHLYAHPEKELKAYLADRNPMLLTDDHAPTDVLVAPLFQIRAQGY
jgi:spermidine synthase/MFS family permease